MMMTLGLTLAGCGSEERGSNDVSGGGLTLPMDTMGGGQTDSTGGGDTEDSGPVATGGGTSADSTAGVDDDGNDTIITLWDLPPFPDLGLPGNACQTDPMADEDGDGFSVVDGDCNDCDPNVNPGAIEVAITEPDMNGMIPEPADEDCDGLIDNVTPPCDAGLALADVDPYSAAAAIGLCKTSSGADDWGLVSAQYVRSNGAPVNSSLQHGLMQSFGTNVQPLEGDSLLALSSGRARVTGEPSDCPTHNCTGSGGSAPPAGFPQNVPGCPVENTIYDDIALEVTLRVPTNATGYSFSFSFYSYEYPEWVCTEYNDQFIALVSPPPPGAINGNISFDAMTNPVSVNIAFFEVCQGCPLGTAELQDTGFDQHNNAGATSWLTTTAPVEPDQQEVTIRFAIWDTGDPNFDSTSIIDNFQWIANGGTVMVGTNPAG
ncbi:MAG: choice-of-anchor L domain-containing protein [Myxococcota bacterium]